MRNVGRVMMKSLMRRTMRCEGQTVKMSLECLVHSTYRIFGVIPSSV